MKTTARTKKAAGLAKAGHRKARQVRKVKAPRVQEAALEALDTIHLHAAGIDIGSQENFVAVPAHSVKAGEPTVRSFGVFTWEQDGPGRVVEGLPDQDRGHGGHGRVLDGSLRQN
jgi:hypothetical protein